MKKKKIEKDELDCLMDVLGFKIVEVPVNGGMEKMKRYVDNKVPYVTAISKWRLRLIITMFNNLRMNRK